MVFLKIFRSCNHLQAWQGTRLSTGFRASFSLKLETGNHYSPQPGREDKVYVAMSGGVDSSVSAFLMKEKGFDVEGVYMRNWDVKEEGDLLQTPPCEEDWKKVQSVCKRLQIPCQRIDFVKEYWSHVFENTLEDYQQGRTPNPDLLCNKEIKFDRLLDHLQQMQAKRKSWLVTGHYARLVQEQTSGYIHLVRGKDPIKDQTYYLATVPTFKFKNVIFPLGGLLKNQIKTIARNIGLNDIADQPESMGICFVGKRQNFTSFLGNYIQETPGSICTVDGTVIGQHQGLWTHTIGQRIRISYRSQKWYVSAKDITTNVITVVPGRNHPALYSTSLQLPNFSWSSKPSLINLDEGTLVQVKIRSTQTPIKCLVRSNSASKGIIDIQFVEPVWAPAPGQFVVLYTLDDVCLGAGAVPYYTP